VTTLLLDSHVLHWWSAEPERLSQPARRAIREAEELAVASISWFELAWLASHERIVVSIPVRSWLEGLAQQVRSVPATPAVAATAVALPASFPGDPADRLIFATAIEKGWQLVTKDDRLRGHRHPRKITVW
jgi:PIN domain nuclease of toxin-antitoxin system